MQGPRAGAVGTIQSVYIDDPDQNSMSATVKFRWSMRSICMAAFLGLYGVDPVPIPRAATD